MNNKFIRYIILLLLSLAIISGCSKYEMLDYKNDPAVYFENIYPGQLDSISHTFFYLPDEAKWDTVFVIVNTMGELSDVDRPITFIQINEGKPNAAKSGIHYVPFDDPKLKPKIIIPAGKSTAKIPFVILRDPSLDLNIIELELSFSENEHFRLGIDDFLKFKIKTTTQTSKPTNWDPQVGQVSWSYVFGLTWGSEKMKFIYKVTRYTDWETMIVDPARMNYFKQKVTDALRKYNLENPENPLQEADGTPVTLS